MKMRHSLQNDFILGPEDTALLGSPQTLGRTVPEASRGAAWMDPILCAVLWARDQQQAGLIHSRG